MFIKNWKQSKWLEIKVYVSKTYLYDKKLHSD